MPEPIISETGFVPGDGVEAASVVSDSPPTALEQGREVIGSLFERLGAPGFQPEVAEEVIIEDDTTSQDSSKPAATEPTVQGREGSDNSSSTNEEEILTLTRAELDRRIQSETDRRESVRNQRIERANKTTQNQQKLERLRQSGDFEGYVQEHTAQEVEDGQQQQELERLSAVQSRVTLSFDSEILDPVVMRLPEEERNSLLEAIKPVGIEGRSKVLIATVDRLLDRAKAEGAANAEKALRNNAAFRKQVLLEARGREDEPDLIPSAGAVTAPQDMNQFVRSLIR